MAVLYTQDIEKITDIVISKLHARFYFIERKEFFIDKIPHEIIIQKVIDYVCERKEIDKNEIIFSRKKEYYQAREIVVFILRKHFHAIPFKKTGEAFQKDHSTLISSYRTICAVMEVDKAYKVQINEFADKFKMEFDLEINKIKVE